MHRDENLALASLVRSRAIHCTLNEADTSDAEPGTKSESDGLVRDMYSAAIEAKERIARGEEKDSVLAWLMAAWVGYLTLAAVSAFRKGASLRAVTVPSGTKAMLDRYPRLKKKIVSQSKFLQGFAKDYIEGVPSNKGRMSFVNRSVLYGKSMMSYYHLGAAISTGTRDLIFWNLGACEHCSDCVALAMSGPYYVDELPTMPGAGQTKCGHWCCCSLSIRPGVRELVSPPSLAIGPLASAGSLRAPTRSEAIEIGDLRLKEAHASRTLQESDYSPDFDSIKSQRDELRSKIDQQIQSKSISFPELLPLGGPIAALFSQENAEEDLDENSMDARSLSRLKLPELDKIISELEQELDGILDD